MGVESRIDLFWKIQHLCPLNWTPIDNRHDDIDDVIYIFNKNSIFVEVIYRMCGGPMADIYMFDIIGPKVNEFRSIVRELKIKEITDGYEGMDKIDT